MGGNVFFLSSWDETAEISRVRTGTALWQKHLLLHITQETRLGTFCKCINRLKTEPPPWVLCNEWLVSFSRSENNLYMQIWYCTSCIMMHLHHFCGLSPVAVVIASYYSWSNRQHFFFSVSHLHAHISIFGLWPLVIWYLEGLLSQLPLIVSIWL